MTEKKKNKDLLPVDGFRDLPARKIREEVCQKYGYFVTEDPKTGDTIQVAPYKDANGRTVAQKVRGKSKKFYTLGDFSKAGLFGQHLARKGGKRLVVTEGEIDAMSVHQALKTWPAVSIPNGAQSAAAAVKENLEFLESYEKIVFMFDGDEPGQKAAQECARVLSPGKACIATLPLKDANEMLKEGRTQELVQAFWEASEYRPDGIVSGKDVWEQAVKQTEQGISYPWPSMNGITYGQRKGELTTWTAGSGMGKSAFVREIEYDLLKQGYKVASIRLEENVGRTAKGLMGIHLNKPIHLPGQEVSEEDMRIAFEATVGCGRFWLLDHFGSLEDDNLMSKMRYLAKGLGVDFIILDHISIVVSGMDTGSDERRVIDNLMTQLRSLVEESGVGMHLISHLKRADKKGHEDGAQISLSQLRGSGAIAQLSDMVIGLERNQQAKSEDARNLTKVRVLKNRFSGETGIAAYVRYDKDTGRLNEVAYEEDFEAEDDEDSDF
ncbi:DnaB-like helicase C-terminal domain-containing protein [Roseibium alexandrii]|uniref:DnaB-like helicase C-terminal domain-containing protein n=1 Tax=Roseibium alexandrii TaxID=388408 RepID=UPI0001948174|nr:DnaB-like helicase C-terminal domain-containing protein [Roseibium alexandrii]